MSCTRGLLVTFTLLVASVASAQDKPMAGSAGSNASKHLPPEASTPERQSNLRRFWNTFKGHGSYPKTRDWTTGRDDGGSKPWLRR